MDNKQIVERLKGLEQEIERIRQRRVYQRDVVFGEIKQQHIDGIIIFRGDSSDLPTDGSTEIQAYYAEDQKKLYIWNTTTDVWESVTLS